MRLATITNWAYGATVALSLVSGATMLLASGAQDRERAAVTQRYRLDQETSGEDEREEMLSGHARQYVVSGHADDLANYERALAQLVPVEGRLRKMRDAGAGPDELAALKDGIAIIDGLQDEQRAAVEARKRGDVNGAIALVFNPQYEAELDRADALFDKFQYRLDQRTAGEVLQATQVARFWKFISECALAATALLFLFVLYFVFRKRVLQPVVKLSDVVTRLAAQDYAAVPPQLAQIDEIGDMAQAIRIFRENGLERQRLERERAADQNLRDLLARMTQRMQAIDAIDDLTEVVARFVPEIAPAYAGRLYLLDGARQVLVQACAWLEPQQSQPEFPPLACWALRRGLPHRPSGAHIDVPCHHLDAAADETVNTICLPLIAQREAFGLLYLEPRPGAAQEETPAVYLTMLAENVALAVANLSLRDALRSMAMADPLTGLGNRRQFETVLALELARSERNRRPLSCVMLDVDHFKRFNDEFGHDAGDAVLRAVGGLLKHSTREGALAFRMGGEEFLVLMPELTTDQAHERAEEIRRNVTALKVQHNGKPLGPVTISLGLATTPDICPATALVEAADSALLRAKRSGRDQVVVAEPRRQSSVA